jgi:protein-L-isoaspartate(D-aspartate) O-methyltransferase
MGRARRAQGRLARTKGTLVATRRTILTGFVVVVASSALGIVACRAEKTATTTQPSTRPAAADDGRFADERAAMVRTQLAARDITDRRVLETMGRVPRHRFVLPAYERRAYADRPLPINQGQTISQPYIVALMTQLAEVEPGDRVLDIGTGSGYQAAVLADLGADVASIEIVPELAAEAKARLAELKYDKVEVRAGDGYRGWPERAPFTAIILAAAAPKVPQPLVDQLAPGGKLVLPVGDHAQELLVITKQADGSVKRETVAPVMFVPMTGEVRERGKPAK